MGLLAMKDLYWAAGFLEGEGWFGKEMQITAAQVEREPLTRLQRVFGGSINWSAQSKRPAANPIYIWSVSGRIAAGIMMSLFTQMSSKRRASIRAALIAWKTKRVWARYRLSCLNGHPFTEDNTKVSNNGLNAHGKQRTRRYCRTCMRKHSRVYNEQHKEERRVLARVRSREWYANNRERARISQKLYNETKRIERLAVVSHNAQN